MIMCPYYQSDLAYIHDDGFGDFAQNAATLTTLLRQVGFRVRQVKGYGPMPFRTGLVGFIANK